MRDLRIVVATPDAERLRAALMLASAHTALGNKASLFLQLDAVGLLKPPITAPMDQAHRAAGLPALAVLIDEAMALGVEMIACQSGLALCGLTPDALPSGVAAGGPVSFLQQTEYEARLLFA